MASKVSGQALETGTVTQTLASSTLKPSAPSTVESGTTTLTPGHWTDATVKRSSRDASRSKRDRLTAFFHGTKEVKGTESWRDASLSDKNRWMKWEKEREKKQYGSTTTYYTGFMKPVGEDGSKNKGWWTWWVGT